MTVRHLAPGYPDTEMRSFLLTNPHRHLLEHAIIVCGIALLTLWWWILIKDGLQQFGRFTTLAKLVSHATGGVFFPTIMMMPLPRPTGAGGILVQYALFAVTALLWMNGPIWLSIAVVGPIRHRLGWHSDAATTCSSPRGFLSFRRALPEYLFGTGASALWGAYKYGQLVAVTADEALRFFLVCALPATLLPLAIMALRRWAMAGWRRLRARSAAA